MEKTNIIREIFNETVEDYKRFLESYYPAHGSNGFTERNLTFNFCHQYLSFREKQNEKDIIVWQEVPIANPEFPKRNNHFDSLIIDNGINTIFYIESKRIRSTNHHKSLLDDLSRMQKCYKYIPEYEKFQSYEKFAILLTDIWTLSEKEDNRSNLKRQIETKSNNLFQEVYRGDNETYHINYELHLL